MRRSNACLSPAVFHQAYTQAQVFTADQSYQAGGRPLAASAGAGGDGDGAGGHRRRLSAAAAGGNVPKVGWVPRPTFHGVVFRAICGPPPRKQLSEEDAELLWEQTMQIVQCVRRSVRTGKH